MTSPTTLEFDSKIAREVTKELSIGLELYDFHGPLRGRAAGPGPSDTTLITTDFSIAKWEVNVGIGQARGDIAEKVVLKAIIGIPIWWLSLFRVILGH